MRYSDLKAAARRGFKLLDKSDPFGRPLKINLDKLDQSDCGVCMIGQLTGVEEYTGFFQMTKALRAHANDAFIGSQEEWNVHHGFEVPNNDDPDADYVRLTKAWREILEERKEI